MGAEALFGELYLRSTRPFLPEVLTDAEASFLRQRLPSGRVLDLGCGHGRHSRRLGPGVVGLDADSRSLEEAALHGPVARGDFRALPFRSRVFRGAYVWYNTLGTFEIEQARAILQGLARCVEPDGLVIVQGTHPGRARDQPRASYEGVLPDGSQLSEESRWRAEAGRDEVHRQLVLPDGRVMAASFFIRYYELEQWRRLLESAGLAVAWACGGIDGSPLRDDSMDVIVGAHKRG